MKGILKKLFPGEDKARGQGPIVKVNLDEVDESDLESFHDTVSEMTGIDFFEGRVEHGYSLKHTGSADRCPRCDAPTRQQYANFIYNTQIAPRVLMAPAGYFCTKCRTVVVDEDLIRKGVTRGFEYRGIMGLDYKDEKPPDVFKTWDGKPPVFVLSGNEELFYGSSGSSRRSEKERRKRKIAREARKRNRRRK
jgi:hypothetical protein